MKFKRRILMPRLRSEHTYLGLHGPLLSMTVTIKSQFSPQQRRLLALSFFRQVQPWVDYFRHIELMQERNKNVNRKPGSPFLNGRSFFISHPVTRFGFEVRMRRLQYGLTQAELAQKLLMSRCHLSLIERGKCTVRPHTMRKLVRALWSAGDVSIFDTFAEMEAGDGNKLGNGGVPSSEH